ncbi:MAG: 30S ribosomal protein S6 [Chloroflexi bacterium]|nr:30S ribosomal protein S6 [Chloroflexota bacterium]
MVSQRNRDYELVMVLSPEANEEELTATVERVSNFITEHGGTAEEPDKWGLRRLSYAIKEFMEGNYVLTRFSLEASNVNEFDRSLTASDDILRHLVTKV